MLVQRGTKKYRILFVDNYDTNVQQISYTDSTNTVVQYSAIQVFQEISTINMWNPVASIVFTSSMLPVQSTNISPPKVYNDSNISSTGNNAGFFFLTSLPTLKFHTMLSINTDQILITHHQGTIDY